MDLRAIAESKLSNELRDQYVGLFTGRYKTAPHLEDTDHQVFNWLAAGFPKQKAISIVKQYFGLTDRFVVEKAFPPKMIRTQINQILAAIGGKEVSKTSSGMLLKIKLSCDKCFLYFDWVGTSEQLGPEYKRVCGSCKPAETVVAL